MKRKYIFFSKQEITFSVEGSRQAPERINSVAVYAAQWALLRPNKLVRDTLIWCIEYILINRHQLKTQKTVSGTGHKVEIDV